MQALGSSPSPPLQDFLPMHPLRTLRMTRSCGYSVGSLSGDWTTHWGAGRLQGFVPCLGGWVAGQPARAKPSPPWR